jgi:Uma2 family endonuclease
MPISEKTFQAILLEDPEGDWELHQGRLREKPAMTASHNQTGVDLAFSIYQQVNRELYTVRVDSARTKRADATYYIPDVLIVPIGAVQLQLGRPDALEIYEEALPFVAEIWSPATSSYDVNEKLPEYMARGDHEIWRLHPYERSVVAWKRQPDGTYTETAYHGGTVQLHALPEVTIDLDGLFSRI